HVLTARGGERQGAPGRNRAHARREKRLGAQARREFVESGVATALWAVLFRCLSIYETAHRAVATSLARVTLHFINRCAELHLARAGFSRGRVRRVERPLGGVGGGGVRRGEIGRGSRAGRGRG